MREKVSVEVREKVSVEVREIVSVEVIEKVIQFALLVLFTADKRFCGLD